jgi:hypothetical protein
VLGLKAHADEAAGEILEAGHAGDNAERKWRSKRTGAMEDGIEEAVGEDLHSLGFSDGGFAIVLNGSEVVYGGTAGKEAFGEDVGGGDCVLYRYVDADAADGGHGVGCVSNAEQAGGAPLAESIDLHGEEFHFVPGVDFGCAPGEKRYDAFDALMECCDAVLLDLREGPFGDEVSDLKVVGG